MPKYYKRPFAESGDKNIIPDDQSATNVSYEEGYPVQYELEKTDPSAKYVERDDQNALLHDLTDNVKQWQENTYPEWIDPTQNDGANFSYPKDAIVVFNGVNYISNESSNNTAPDDVSTKWRLLDTRISDFSYVKLTSGTTALTQSATGTYVYNIADFTGTGLVASEIRKLHIRCETRSNGARVTISATYPDGSTEVICGNQKVGGSEDDTSCILIADVPVNKNQSSVTLTISTGNVHVFTIIGATQRTFE